MVEVAVVIEVVLVVSVAVVGDVVVEYVALSLEDYDALGEEAY